MYCKTAYDLSGTDYSVKVTGDQTNGYALEFSATTTGKFKNIDLTSDNKCPLSNACSANEIKVNFDSNGRVTAGHKENASPGTPTQ